MTIHNTSYDLAQDVNRLLQKGFYPINALPRDTILRIPTEAGPSLLSEGLPKISSGTRDTQNSPIRTVGGNVSWGPVVYLVLWKLIVRRQGHALRQFAEDIPRYKHNPDLQVALLTQYAVGYLEIDPARATLRIAIEGALRMLALAGGKKP